MTSPALDIDHALGHSPDLALALALASRWAREAPEDPRAWSKLAHIHHLSRRFPEAALAARAAIDLAPHAPELRFKLGMALFFGSDPGGAASAFAHCARVSLEIDDDFYLDSARLAQARCLLDLGRAQDALGPLLAADPNAGVWLGERLNTASLLARAEALRRP